MNDHKFCFIACTNNELLMSECIEYINRLYIPEGYDIDLLTVTEAKSMTSGYNEAMKSSDAKYKIYLHQDVFITNRYFLYNILDIFESDSNIGMIGMVGYPQISKTGMMWEERRVGAVPMYGASEYYSSLSFEDYRYDLKDGYTSVSVADGLMLITSRDLEWDEEFDAWDFYDATQCMRFINSNYKIVVPNQKMPWFVHDDGLYLSVWNYNKYRHLFLEKYGSLIEKINSQNKCELDDKKIAFIVCVNNELFFNECVWYINNLKITDYSVEIIPIRDANSMAQGYNIAMHSSDAKYKFYIHQDTFIVNKKIINSAISRFMKDEKLGMLGIMGTNKLREDAVFWDKWDIGRIMISLPNSIKDFRCKNSTEEVYNAVALDGVFMATQYDVEWREDIGLMWDYYDISQSMEFTSRGFKIGVLSGNESCLIHDCGVTNVKNIDSSRALFISAYSNMRFKYTPDNQYDLSSMNSERVTAAMKEWFNDRKYDNILELGASLDNTNGYSFSTDSRYAYLFTLIEKRERENGAAYNTIDSLDDFEECKRKYLELVFSLRRTVYDCGNESRLKVQTLKEQEKYSDFFINEARKKAILTAT